MKTILVLLTLLLGALPLCGTEIKVGAQWPYLKAANGKVFVDVKFTFVSPREVRFMHTNGIGSLLLADVVMPEDVTVSSTPPSTTMGPMGAMMSPEERKLIGIDKLNNEEQAVLVSWLAKAVNQAVQEERQKAPAFAAGPGAAAAGTPVTAAANGTMPLPPDGARGVAVDSPAASPAMAMMPAPAGSTARTLGAARTSAMLSPPPPKHAPTVASSPALLPPAEPAAGQVASQPPAPPPGDAQETVAPTSLVSAAPGMPLAKPVMAATGMVESQIDGEFKGFHTGKEYRLANGQVWRQHEVYVSSHSAYEPGVMIYPTEGGWMMKVDGVEKAVRVTPFP